jgi:uncharacterized protein (TIGR02145 family)
MKHLLKKHRMLSVGIFLAAVLSIIYAAILSPAGKSTGSFSEFCTTLFREEMKSNTMNLHFTLKDPKAAGIDSYEITLGSLSGDSPHNQARQLKKLSEELKKYSHRSLGEKERLTCRLLSDYISRQQNLAAYPYNDKRNFVADIQQHCPVPVTIENDAKCAALAEAWKGSLVGCKNGIVVVLQNNGAAIPWDTFGVLTMPLTGASNSINLVPRIDVKSIPASATAAVDVTFGTQTWMDRNLGARRVATAINDVLSYGNHYQWGRPADGHEISVWNGATPTSGRGFANATALEALATSDAPGHANFILTNVTPFDWRDDNNNNRWATANQGPCPAGYHVPTDAQWATADAFNGGAATNGGATVGWDNNTETYESALKLPSAGFRLRVNGLLYSQGTGGLNWSSTVSGANARILRFGSTAANTYSDFRADGYTVRCLKD